VLFTLGAAIVALACVVASGRRLAHAVAPTGLDPRMVAKALEQEAGEKGVAVLRALRSAAATDGRLQWESELFAAFDEADERQRDALVNEQLLELEGRLARSSRVPRVCASIATSAGLLLGTLALVRGLATPPEEGGIASQGALSSALAAVSLGIAATAFCVAVHVRAGRIAAERRAAFDDLVALLQRLRSGASGAGERASS
jgi:hypothetical protein